VPTLPNKPRKLTIGNFDQELDPNAKDCDLTPLAFIDAYGLVETACALRLALSEETGLLIKAPSNEATRSHLSAMGLRDFLEGFGLASLLPESPTFDASDVVVPLRSGTQSGGEQAASHLLWEQLQGDVSPQVLEALAEGIWEMVGNAQEHSGSDPLIMAQVYNAKRGKKSFDHNNRVQVVVGDSGRGIRESFLATGAHQPASDLEAIELALQYLVTSVVGDPGRGQGLSTTMEQVIGLQGHMVVRSGSGKVSIDADRTMKAKVPMLAGTVVALSLPLYPG
jgi:hypothetical protein